MEVINKKIESNKILYSKWNNDECYTPAYWVKPIIKYINNHSFYWAWWIYKTPIIRCPFDKENSEFVKQIKKAWYNVIYSHIDNWQDFFEYEPEKWDIIISNPPFTNKRKFFEKALSFWKPFALIMTLTWLSDSGSKLVYLNQDKQMQLLLFDKRIKFNSPDWRLNNKITFGTWYYCYNFLPKDLILEKIQLK